MTKEQVITRIKHNSMYKDDRETADYIIKALEQQPCEDCEYNRGYRDGYDKGNLNGYELRKAEEKKSDDCVSRAEVMKIYDEWFATCDIADKKASPKAKIKALPPVRPTQRWIPVSERLPEDRDWYLGIFKEHDTGWINPVPFICDYVGRETKATTKEFWILRGLTDIDNPYDYYKNLECVAWQPLPKPYEEKRGNENEVD